MRSVACPIRFVLCAGALFLGISFIAGCPRPTRSEVAFAPAASLPATTPLAAQLGSGDTFEVRVFQEPDLSGLYRVGPEGTIDFPFCGRLSVGGQTGPEIAGLLRGCLSDGYLRSPQVTVVARDVGSKKVSVFGHVQKPGTFAFENDMTIVQAITLAGGFAQFAGQNSTTVIRSAGAGAEQKFKVPVQDIGVGRSPNFHLRPGDIVYVPESAF